MAKLETCGGKGLAQQGSKDALLEGLEDFLRENAERRLCMAAVDVEHFKLDEAGCNWEQYSPSMREKLKQRQQLLIEIERALQNKEFCFYLQPKCNSMTHAIVGMEALVRWNHPTRGIVSPGEFVPLMEETGLITRLDLYLWEEVCQMLHGWKARNENMVPISVNVSISDIAALDVAQVLWELVQKYQLEPKLLLVEITESMLAQNLKMVENTIAALHRKGFAVLMDDFGSGYSSLNMLRNTSVDAIKLDMQFIVRDSESSKGRQIVESVIEMARRLNLPIIAEGVETQEQVFMLPTMKTLDPKKAENKAEKAAVNGSAEDATVSAPSVQIDLSKVKIEPLFADDVDFETFSKSDFRVVKIEACEAVPKSKKLLKFTLNDGTDRKRTILSGIHEYYEPEELVGKTCVAITNLPPRKMMGIDSEGMLISAVYEYDGREGLNLLMLDDSIPAGAKLY